MDLLAAFSGWSVAAALRRSAVLYPLVNAAHILGIGVLVGSIFTLDARVLGAFGRVPLSALGPPLVRMAGIGLAAAAATGFLLFSVRPAAYAANPAFLVKLGLIVLGLLNVLALHLGSGWRRALAGGDMAAPVRVAAALSLMVWTSAVLAGRWIGFTE
ncbi:MAG TPA: DUF2214 domain-containing protein [Roseomonas sp.]